jgi:hypothetical protein
MMSQVLKACTTSPTLKVGIEIPKGDDSWIGIPKQLMWPGAEKGCSFLYSKFENIRKAIHPSLSSMSASLLGLEILEAWDDVLPILCPHHLAENPAQSRRFMKIFWTDLS